MARIVYANNAVTPGGSANSVNVTKMCAAIASHGHDVTLICLRPPGEQRGLDVATYYELSHRFEMLRFPPVLAGGRAFALGAAMSARWLGADMVMTRMPRVGWGAARLGLPVILELHAGLDWVGPQRTALQALARSGRLAALVVISEALAEHYRGEMPEAADRILVAHDGADPVAETLEPPPASPSERLRVGYAGHLYPGKGMEIIAALAPLCPWADFEIVGGRPEDVADWRARTAGTTNLRYHGAVPHAEVNGWLAGFDVVLAPYLRQVIVSDGRTDVARWMSPLKIFEYMAAGRAIVTSDLPVLREVLEHERTALLCDPDDLGAWAAALNRLRDAAARRRLGDTARATFLDHYTWARRAEKILAHATREADPSGH